MADQNSKLLNLLGITAGVLSIGIQTPVKAENIAQALQTNSVPVTADFNYWSGLCDLLRNQKKYAAALPACNQALNLKKKDAVLWAIRSDLLSNLGQYEEAVISAATAIRRQSKYSLALTYQCRAFSELGKQEAAIAACNQALQVNKHWGNNSPALAWDNRGLALSRLGRNQEALTSYQMAIELKPNYSLALTHQCQTLSDVGREEDAIMACDQALQVNGDWGGASPALAWNNRGLALSQFGQYKEALATCTHPHDFLDRLTTLLETTNQCIKKNRLSRLEAAIDSYGHAVALNPNDATAWTHQGALLTELGRYAQARIDHEWAIKISPTYSLALANQCATLNKLSMYKEALASCDHALQGDGQWGDMEPAYAWLERSQSLTGLKQYEEALAAVKQAIALKADYAEAWNTQSAILWYLQKYQEALTSNDRAVALTPDSFQGWFNRGRILSSLEQNEEAIAAYERSLRADLSLVDQPSLADVWANRSAALWHLSRYQEALKSANTAVGINPKSVEAWLNQGVALEALKQYQEAVLAYQQALCINPKKADIWSALSRPLLQLRRYKEALTAFEEVLKIEPNNSQVQQNRDSLLQQLNSSSILNKARPMIH